ncbi:MAG TPA: MFS transporter, partial [Anaerolineaceae bacterium]|nr:MFS transporter [Anaerolineaceae bacterium]
KGDRRNIIAIFIIVFCSLFGFFFIQTWLPTYLELERDIAKESVGFISSLVAWSSIPGALLWARLSDRFKNRKPFMVGLLLFALASTLGTGLLKSFPLLIVSLVLYGLTGKLALDPLLVSSLADNAPSKNPGTLFSTFNFIGMSASIVAPYVGGFLQDKTGSLSGTFYLAAGFLMIGLIVALFVYHEKKSPAQISAA